MKLASHAELQVRSAQQILSRILLVFMFFLSLTQELISNKHAY